MDEFQPGAEGLKKYMRDLFRRHEGEVVETWGEWRFHGTPIPRDDESAWHSQFATRWSDRVALGAGHWQHQNIEDLPRTTVLSSRGSHSHSRRAGCALTLGELMLAFGSTYTLMDLCYWYYNAQRVVHKRDHPKPNQETKDAAVLRYRETGWYGFGKAKSMGWRKT